MRREARDLHHQQQAEEQRDAAARPIEPRSQLREGSEPMCGVVAAVMGVANADGRHGGAVPSMRYRRRPAAT